MAGALLIFSVMITSIDYNLPNIRWVQLGSREFNEHCEGRRIYSKTCAIREDDVCVVYSVHTRDEAPKKIKKAFKKICTLKFRKL